VPYTPAELYRRAIGGIDASLPDGPFAQLAPDRQDRLLTQLETGETAAGDIPGNVFFSLLWQNTLEGYFADPVYKGNREMIGWKMIGFPGAHAYYMDTVDDFGDEYFKPPAGIAHRPGRGAVAPFTPARVGRGRG
jgi:gluconate 2-dehydrogenase gamma chain